MLKCVDWLQQLFAGAASSHSFYSFVLLNLMSSFAQSNRVVDPANKLREPNEFGEENSVMWVDE